MTIPTDTHGGPLLRKLENRLLLTGGPVPVTVGQMRTGTVSLALPSQMTRVGRLAILIVSGVCAARCSGGGGINRPGLCERPSDAINLVALLTTVRRRAELRRYEAVKAG